MAWFGKIIGGILGYSIGGPLGMIAGAVFGHMLDKSAEMQQDGSSGDRRGRYYFYNTGYNRSQMVFFVGAFSIEPLRMASMIPRVSLMLMRLPVPFQPVLTR